MIVLHNIADKPFAASISGYLIPVLAIIVSIVLFVVARMQTKQDQARNELNAFRARLETKLETQDSALATNTLALTKVLQRVDDQSTTIAQVPPLREAVAVLKSRIDEHDQWAKDQRRELQESIQRKD